MLRALQCRSVLTLGLVFAVVGGFSAQSQEASSQQTASVDQPTVFRSGITLVTTDVIVRDGNGVFLPDLTVDDFQVFEDDVLQDVESLVLIHGGRVFNQLLPPPPPQEGIVLPPTRARNDTAGRIFILFVDDLHIVTRDTPRMREVFSQVADNLIHEGDLFAIVSTGPSSIRVDMTFPNTTWRETHGFQ